MSADPFDDIQPEPEPAAKPNGKAEAAPPAERAGDRNKLVAIGCTATLWKSGEGDAFATIERGGHLEHHPIRSRVFKEWMRAIYADKYKVKVDDVWKPGTPGRRAMDEAIEALEGFARLDGAVHEAAMRSVALSGRIFVDIGDDAWRAIAVDRNGWRMVDRAPVPILRSRKAIALASPSSPGDARLLGELFKLPPTDLRLIVSYMVGALWPSGPYPVLAMSGEQASGKTTLMRMLKRLVDPAGADILAPPKDDRDLVAFARHNRLLAFDNISSLPHELADSICRLSTGAELGGRALFTDHDAETFAACRPLIINGIPELATRGDLASRSIHIAMPALASTDDEATLWRRFDELAPAIVGGILSGLSRALRDLSKTPVPQGLRMADFARLAAAAAPALGWGADQIVDDLRENAAKQTITVLEADAVGEAVLTLVRNEGGFEGTAGALLGRLAAIAGEGATRGRAWPQTPHFLSQRLMRLAPALRAVGIDVQRTRSMVLRGIKLSKLPSYA